MWKTVNIRTHIYNKMKKSIFTWDNEKDQWLRENYTKGRKYCAEILKTSVQIVSTRLFKLKLKLTSEEISDLYCSFDFNYWSDLTNPEVVYLLGYFWADGCLEIKRRRFRLG